jgi:hypothetical protein
LTLVLPLGTSETIERRVGGKFRDGRFDVGGGLELALKDGKVLQFQVLAVRIA